MQVHARARMLSPSPAAILTPPVSLNCPHCLKNLVDGAIQWIAVPLLAYSTPAAWARLITQATWGTPDKHPTS